jgi:hypothetical protein
MDNKLTTLNALEELVREHKKKSLDLSKSRIVKNLISSNFNSILKIIDELKDAEKEQSRLDWKAGYVDCCLDVSEWLGNKKDDSFITEDEMEVIESLSYDYVNKKNEK